MYAPSNVMTLVTLEKNTQTFVVKCTLTLASSCDMNVKWPGHRTTRKPLYKIEINCMQSCLHHFVVYICCLKKLLLV